MRRSIGTLLIGLTVGAVIGFVLGLLFAPQSGAATRRKVADKAQKTADAAKLLAERAEQTAGIIGGRVDHYLGREEEAAWRKVNEARKGMRGYTQTQV